MDGRRVTLVATDRRAYLRLRHGGDGAWWASAWSPRGDMLAIVDAPDRRDAKQRLLRRMLEDACAGLFGAREWVDAALCAGLTEPPTELW